MTRPHAHAATRHPLLGVASRLSCALLMTSGAAGSIGCGADAPSASASGGASSGGTSGSSSGGSAGAETLPGPEEWNREVTAPPAQQAANGRLACDFEAGALPKETHAAGEPMGKDIPIDHVLVIMMENRSFDHYFQKIRDIGIDADVAPDTYTNPDEEGQPVAPFRDTQYCLADTPHSWRSVHRQINGGAMDGFALTATGTHELPMNASLEHIEGKRALTYYTQEDVPLVYWLAENFSIGDRYFSSVPTSTWPNREYLWAATSFGQKSNNFPTEVDKTIFTYLNEREVNWKFYYQNTPSFAMLLDEYFKYRDAGFFVSIDEYYKDAAAGTLPQVAIVDPGPSVREWEGVDEHLPAQMDVGQNWMARVVSSLVASPNWERSALFITYDEHGGLYDHVPPPKACPPDDRRDALDDGEAFDQYGVRVPFFAISPFAKQGYVSHNVYDHTSILRFIQARFTLPALTARDANAEAPFDLFDFKAPPKRGDLTLPPVEINQSRLAKCESIWNE